MTEAHTSTGVLEAIRLRRAVRAFRSDPLPDSTVFALLDAAVHAPTAMHREPWVFAIVQDRSLLRLLSERVKAQWRAKAPQVAPHVLAALPEAGGFQEALARPDFNVFYDAGTLIVICARPLSRFVQADCWLAAENLMLAACGLGLGSCVIGAAIETLQLPEVKVELGIPADLIPVAPIIVGVPSRAVPPTSRRPPEIVSWKH